MAEYGNYWLASRYLKDSGNYSFGVRNVDASGKVGSYLTFCQDFLNKWRQNYTREAGLRTVFYLNLNVKIIGGSGTSGDPYELGL